MSTINPEQLTKQQLSGLAEYRMQALIALDAELVKLVEKLDAGTCTGKDLAIVLANRENLFEAWVEHEERLVGNKAWSTN